MTALALCEEESMSQRIFTAVEINNLKREAKRLSKRDGIPHVEALNRIALREGFASWWHLQNLSGKAQPASSSSPSGSNAEAIIKDLQPDLAYRLMEDSMLEETRRLLTANGFVEEPPGFLGQSLVQFTRSIDGSSLKIGASWSNVTDEHVELGLELSKQQQRTGTIYRTFSAAALTKALPSILAALGQLAANPDLLKCPECGMNYVHLKEPRPGTKKFLPFLSCAGMRVVRKSFEGERYKDVGCRGIQKKIPALQEYR